VTTAISGAASWRFDDGIPHWFQSNCCVGRPCDLRDGSMRWNFLHVVSQVSVRCTLHIRYYPVPDRSGEQGIVFDRFLCFFVSLLARLRENGWTDMHEIFREGAEWPWDDRVTFLDNSEKPCEAAMCNTGMGFVVLLHHSLLYVFYSRSLFGKES